MVEWVVLNLAWDLVKRLWSWTAPVRRWFLVASMWSVLLWAVLFSGKVTTSPVQLLRRAQLRFPEYQQMLRQDQPPDPDQYPPRQP